MLRHMQDQKRRDVLARGDVGDGGKVFVLLGVIAKLLAVPPLGLRLSVHAASRLCRLDDGRHIIGVTIHGDASFEAGEGHALRLEVAIIRAEQRRELSAG